MFKEFQNSVPTCWLSVKQNMSVKSLGVYADTGKKTKIPWRITSVVPVGVKITASNKTFLVEKKGFKLSFN